MQSGALESEGQCSASRFSCEPLLLILASKSPYDLNAGREVRLIRDSLDPDHPDEARYAGNLYRPSPKALLEEMLSKALDLCIALFATEWAK